jgi:hypothetical protein
MGEVLDKIWAVCLVLFLMKSLADLYMSYYKWVQALDAKAEAEGRGVNERYDIEKMVVANMGNRNFPLVIAMFVLVVAVFSLLLRSEARFPALTMIVIFASAAISVLGGLGDWRRSAARPRGR